MTILLIAALSLGWGVCTHLGVNKRAEVLATIYWHKAHLSPIVQFHDRLGKLLLIVGFACAVGVGVLLAEYVR